MESMTKLVERVEYQAKISHLRRCCEKAAEVLMRQLSSEGADTFLTQGEIAAIIYKEIQAAGANGQSRI